MPRKSRAWPSALILPWTLPASVLTTRGAGVRLQAEHQGSEAHRGDPQERTETLNPPAPIYQR